MNGVDRGCAYNREAMYARLGGTRDGAGRLVRVVSTLGFRLTF